MVLPAATTSSLFELTICKPNWLVKRVWFGIFPFNAECPIEKYAVTLSPTPYHILFSVPESTTKVAVLVSTGFPFSSL